MIVSFITFSFLAAMDKPAGINIKEITAVANPLYINFTNEPHIITITEKDNIFYIDWKQNKRIRTIPLSAYPLSCFTNSQKDMIAITAVEKVTLLKMRERTIQDIPTKYNPWLSASTFTPNNTLYTIEGNGEIHSNPKTNNLPTVESDYRCTITSHHTKEEIYYIDTVRKTDTIPAQLSSQLSTLHLDEKPIRISSCELPELSAKPGNLARLLFYSSIGDLIAFYYPWENMWSIYNVIDKKIIKELPRCSVLTFHPKKLIAAILTKKGYIKLYDLEKDRKISETNISSGTPPDMQALNPKCIDFSPDGEYLAVTVNDQCFVLSNLYPKNV
jgi:WD40 repeat protein